MQEALLAAVRPGNTPHGYNLTFAFPMLMFIIIAGALYLRFRGPHNVPGHVSMTSSRWARAGTGTVNTGESDAHASAAPDEVAEPATAEPGQAQPADEGTEDGE